jgi:predicted sulfurtransferase
MKSEIMGKILLFYKYIDIDKPEAIMAWQRELCQALGLKGRIIIAHEGINGTVGGTIEATERYKQAMLNHELFNDVDFKESNGGAEYFPKLQIKVKNEIVCLRLDTQEVSYKNAGKHLTPKEAHKLIESSPEDLVVLDGRNNYESKIGTFENAITPDINNFRDFPEYIDKNLDQFKDKQVLMFCTGGIRCERASAYLKLKGIAKDVYQIKGGIHRYTEEFPDGYFRGKNYVFDARIAMKVTDEILAQCEVCCTIYDEYTNCVNAECNKQIIVCQTCIKTYHNTCSEKCLNLVKASQVNVRIKPNKLITENQTSEK